MVAFLVVGCSRPEPCQEQTEAPTNQPNIIFLLADDLDYDSTRQMPSLRSQLIEKGASFENAFVSYPLCCPSRATILTGLYAHNHGVRANNPPRGGFEKFVSEGDEENTIAVCLQQNGYKTGLFGKYLNHYPGDDPTYVPPGWDEWYAWSGTEYETEGDKERSAEYYGYNLNENGEVISYGNSSEDYVTDVLSGKATDFVRRATSDSKPFFLYLAPTAPHGPPVPAERHQGALVPGKAPRPHRSASRTSLTNHLGSER